MQETEIDIIDSENQGIVSKIKNWIYDNWQTVLVVLIVLIVGMSAYYYNQNGNGTNNDGSIAATEENKSDNTNTDNTADNDGNEEAAAENKDQENAASEDTKDAQTSNPTENKSATTSPTSDNSGTTFKVAATKGDGITHLARKALGEYLKETGQGSDLTPEHKIYIEDYIQNRTASQKVTVGLEMSFSEKLITDAISSSRTLSQKSLANLKKYIK